MQKDRVVIARCMVFHLHLAFSHTECCSTLEKKKTFVIISLPVSTTISNVTLQLFYQEIRSISPSLNTDWPYDLLWPKECGISDTKSLISTSSKLKPQETKHLHLWSWDPAQLPCEEDPLGLWMTRDHIIHVSHPRPVS